jgi:hypothetical protein
MLSWILILLFLTFAATAAGAIILNEILTALSVLSSNVDRLIAQQAGSIPPAGVQSIVDGIAAVNAKVEGAIVP